MKTKDNHIMKIQFLIVVLIPFYALIGCSTDIQYQTLTSTVRTTMDDLLDHSTPLNSTTITPFRETTTPTVSFTSRYTATSQSGIDFLDTIRTCKNEGVPIETEDEFFDGLIAYRAFNPNGLFIFSGVTLQEYSIPVEGQKGADLIGFSPNGKSFAYALNDAPVLGLFTTSGDRIVTRLDADELLQKIPDGASLGGWFKYKWINDKLIASSISYRINKDAVTNEKFQVIFDPYSGNLRDDLLDQLPDIHPNSEVFFSPDMTRAVYFADKGSYSGELRLWDMKNKIQLWNISNHQNINSVFMAGVFRTVATWSPDSRLFAYIDAENHQKKLPLFDQAGIFLLDREGKTLNLITNFQAQYDNFRFRSMDLSWSSDSRFLAFVFGYGSFVNISHQILIYDIYQERLTFSCPIYGYYDHANIFWSPDNQQIAYSLSISSPMIILDIATGEVKELKQNVILGGWTKTYFNNWP